MRKIMIIAAAIVAASTTAAVASHVTKFKTSTGYYCHMDPEPPYTCRPPVSPSK